MMLRVLAFLLAAWLGSGCAHQNPCQAGRPFDFQADTFSFSNELVWEYGYNADGKWKSQRRTPRPDYSHHCFVVARAARQFFQHAHFEPTQPRLSQAENEKRIRKVISHSPRRPIAAKVVIPGYANLREFSVDYEQSLKKLSGSASQSYLQRGHWRMLLPFTDGHQERTAARLERSLARNCPPVIHLVRFPSLAINHAAVVFDARASEAGIEFSVYDPNQPERPVPLTFDRKTRRFHFPQNDYFRGGRVDIYQIYHSPWY